MTGPLNRLIPLLGLLASLALAYGLDQWLYIQSRNARVTSNFAQLYIWDIVCGLLLIAIWSALAWVTLILSRRSVVVSLIFVALGISVYCYPYFYMANWLPGIPFLPYLPLQSTLSFTGLFIAVLGILHLLLPISGSENS